MLNFHFCRLISIQQKDRIQRLKKYLNLLVIPSPNLPENNEFDFATHEAIKNFKKRVNRERGKSIVEDGSLTNTLWKFIGQYLARIDSGKWLIKEYEDLDKTGDFELHQLFLGNPSSNYTEEIRLCDEKLARLFGGDGAVVSTIIDPAELMTSLGVKQQNAGKARGYGHSAIPCNELLETNDRGGIIHIFANEQGLPGDVGLYVPSGFTRIFEVKGQRGEIVKLSSGINNQKYFCNNNRQKPLYIVYVHVKTEGVIGIGYKKSNGSIKIGNIGGPEGVSYDKRSGYSYAHTHIVFLSEYFGNPFTGTRVDSRDYFCK